MKREIGRNLFTIYDSRFTVHVSSRAAQMKRREKRARRLRARARFSLRRMILYLVPSVEPYLLAGALGALTLTSTFVDLLPNRRPPNSTSASTTTIMKITSTATTPVLPLPPSP